MFAADTKRDLMDWILACVIVILGLPLSWLLWYRSLYHSQINDSFSEYSKFFIHGAVHFAWSLWVIVSPPVWLV
jgi:SCAMP family